MTHQPAFVAEDQLRRYEQAEARGRQWLLGRLRPDGSFDVQNDNLRCYLKSPLALLMAGASGGRTSCWTESRRTSARMATSGPRRNGNMPPTGLIKTGRRTIISMATAGRPSAPTLTGGLTSPTLPWPICFSASIRRRAVSIPVAGLQAQRASGRTLPRRLLAAMLCCFAEDYRKPPGPGTSFFN